MTLLKYDGSSLSGVTYTELRFLGNIFPSFLFVTSRTLVAQILCTAMNFFQNGFAFHMSTTRVHALARVTPHVIFNVSEQFQSFLAISFDDLFISVQSNANKAHLLGTQKPVKYFTTAFYSPIFSFLFIADDQRHLDETISWNDESIAALHIFRFYE